MVLLIFLSLIVSVLGQVATPTRKVGFSYSRGHPLAKVHIEVFLDLVCPDSKATWPHVKDVANHYGPLNVALTVHLFPLPYHQNAFYLSRAAFVLHSLTNGTRTFDWIDKILLEKLADLNDRVFHNNSDSDLLEVMAGYVTEMGLNPTEFLQLVDRRTSNDFERYTRIMWKHACARGVAGTPTYIVNGIIHPNIGSSWQLAEWQAFIDPLVQPQLFDDVDNYVDIAQPLPCKESTSGATTVITTSRHILFMATALLCVHRAFPVNV